MTKSIEKAKNNDLVLVGDSVVVLKDRKLNYADLKDLKIDGKTIQEIYINSVEKAKELDKLKEAFSQYKIEQEQKEKEIQDQVIKLQNAIELTIERLITR